ncbi:hypothetical protein R82526_01076 [Ralstonia mannitolilytica]|uniref:hypothetical protein n=2 Tax=Ralstonia mannitolilytica TaxID=105219 RepID=UPI0028F549C0|nr:hypothetical protein [Ralstonia mannitolilytica]CAJ0681122.1 hypothetical protein R82526_01076 [Ralstonia mannitolilytica]
MPTAHAHAQTSGLDPIHVLAKSFKLILLAGLIGAVLGLVASQIIHPRWVARMTIQLGQVSIPDAKGSLVPQPLENQLTAVERYNLPSFRLQVLHDLGLASPDTGNKDSDLVFKSLKATAGRSPNVINVEVSAYSREAAATTLETALKTFSVEHRKLFDQAISNMQSDQAIAQGKLAIAQRDYARISETLKSVATLRTAASTSAREVLASNTASLINAQILELQQQVTAYQDALGPLRSYPTKAMGPTYVPVRSSTPGMTIFIAAGAAMGLILAGGLVLLKDTFRTT